jgi:hypothetical protein
MRLVRSATAAQRAGHSASFRATRARELGLEYFVQVAKQHGISPPIRGERRVNARSIHRRGQRRQAYEALPSQPNRLPASCLAAASNVASSPCRGLAILRTPRCTTARRRQAVRGRQLGGRNSAAVRAPSRQHPSARAVSSILCWCTPHTDSIHRTGQAPIQRPLAKSGSSPEREATDGRLRRASATDCCPSRSISSRFQRSPGLGRAAGPTSRISVPTIRARRRSIRGRRNGAMSSCRTRPGLDLRPRPRLATVWLTQQRGEHSIVTRARTMRRACRTRRRCATLPSPLNHPPTHPPPRSPLPTPPPPPLPPPPGPGWTAIGNPAPVPRTRGTRCLRASRSQTGRWRSNPLDRGQTAT